MTTKYINASAGKRYKLVNVWDLPLNLIPRLWNSPLKLQWGACSEAFIYKHCFAVLGSAGYHLLFIVQLLLFTLFLATVVHSGAKCLSLHFNQTVQTLSLHFTLVDYSFLISILKSCSTRLICREHVFGYANAISDFSSVLQQVC